MRRNMGNVVPAAEEREKKTCSRVPTCTTVEYRAGNGIPPMYIHVCIYLGREGGGLCASHGKRSWERKKRTVGVTSGGCAL